MTAGTRILRPSPGAFRKKIAISASKPPPSSRLDEAAPERPGSPKGAGAGPGVWGPGAGAEALAAEGQPTLASPRKLEESEGGRGAPSGIAVRRSEPASWYAPPPGRSPSMLGSLPGSRPGRAGSEPLPGPIGSEGSSAAVSKTPALLSGPREI